MCWQFLNSMVDWMQHDFVKWKNVSLCANTRCGQRVYKSQPFINCIVFNDNSIYRMAVAMPSRLKIYQNWTAASQWLRWLSGWTKPVFSCKVYNLYQRLKFFSYLQFEWTGRGWPNRWGWLPGRRWRDFYPRWRSHKLRHGTSASIFLSKSGETDWR